MRFQNLLKKSLYFRSNFYSFNEFSLATKPAVETHNLETYRTDESNPVNHNRSHIGKFYVLPKDIMYLYKYGGIPKSYMEQANVFNEVALMIRSPSIEVIEYLQQLDFNRPVMRFCFWGHNGCGKSLSMAHLIHYGSQSGYLLIHVPYVSNWTRKPQEYCHSVTHTGFYDLPLDGGNWLSHFKMQNLNLLESLNLKTTQDYVWSPREMTPKDSPIINLIDHGINRIKFSCGVISVLIDELKRYANNGSCKIMVLIDGFNSFFYPITKIKDENHNVIHPNRITLTEAFLNITKHDWCNGVVILTADRISANIDESLISAHYPKYLLGRTGFEHIDPFVPIQCTEYSLKEGKSLLNYYRNRKWIRNDPEFDEEIIALHANNPFRIMNYCATL